MSVRARPTCKYSKFSFEIGSPLPSSPRTSNRSVEKGEEQNWKFSTEMNSSARKKGGVSAVARKRGVKSWHVGEGGIRYPTS